ncbi:ATP-binding protein [Propylenella binzhouense]|nr:ATP-binding protein [Propylenella binzhouense]
MQPHFQSPQDAPDARLRAFPIGRVVSVDGAHAVITAPRSDPEALAGEESPLSVGKLLSINAGPVRVIGVIYATAAANQGGQEGEIGPTLVKVELVGQIRDGAKPVFERGIQHYPPIGAGVLPVGPTDLITIYDYGSDETIVIGRLGQDPSIEATVRVQDLLQKHFAVLGTTGCGKSTSVSLILHEILKSSQGARVLLIDPHNEYKGSFGELAHLISPRNLNLPYWLFNFEEFTDVIYRRRPGVPEELDALADFIPLAKARYAQKQEKSSLLLRRDVDDAGHTVDSPVPYRLSDLLALIDDQLGKLEGKEDRPRLRRLRARIQSVAQDPRYQFMFSSRTIEDSMAELLKTLFRIPTEGKPITIVELAGFPAEVVDAVVSVLCRLAFELGMWGNGRVPILVVAEEAHRYVPADKRLGFGPTRRAISRIAKEGRKYGVYLGVVTQRPSELDPTILSQCSTIFAMRLANDADHAIIRSAVSDAATSTLEALPSMGNREALAFGEAVSMPMRVRFTNLPESMLPKSKLRGLQDDSAEAQSGGFVEEVVQRWRSVEHRGR